MSNRAALIQCEELILALEECQNKHNFLQKVAGSCFDLEKAVRMCRHEARLEDRKKHVEVALSKRQKQQERWQKIETDQD